MKTQATAFAVILLLLIVFCLVVLWTPNASGAELIGKTSTPRSLYGGYRYPVVPIYIPPTCPRPVRVIAPPVKPSAAVLKAASGVSYNPGYVEPPYSPPVMIYNPYVKQ